jgi:hypothetical protein
MQEAMAEDGFLNRAVFSNESTFHSIGKVLRHNVRVENPHAIVQHEKASEKIFLGNVHTNILWGFLFP